MEVPSVVPGASQLNEAWVPVSGPGRYGDARSQAMGGMAAGRTRPVDWGGGG